NIFTNKSFTTYKPKPGVLYYDCWYTFELNLIKPSVVIPMKVASRKWIFHTPDCITINNSRICGCPCKEFFYVLLCCFFLPERITACMYVFSNPEKSRRRVIIGIRPQSNI
ncbi:Hypothetical predicted protein, partial [Paramuricea clavata]